MIAREGKAGRTFGEKWSAILVPSPAASNTGFLDDAGYLRLKGELPEYLRPLFSLLGTTSATVSENSAS